MLENQQEIQQLIQKELQSYTQKNAYGVSLLPAHAHTGVDSLRIDPIDLLGFPASQVTSALTAPTDNPANGTIRFYYDSTPNYIMWVTINGLWKIIRSSPLASTVTSSATPSINVNTTDFFTITALATAITSMTSGLSGTPIGGQKLIIRFLDNGTARAITWGASYASRGATLPTTTVLGKYMYVGLIYNSVTATWDCVSVANEQ